MFNKIRKINSSATPAPARAYAGPATVGIDFDEAATVGALQVRVDEDTLKTLVDTDTSQLLSNKLSTKPVETVAAANVITAAESGKTFFLSAATEFESTLPAPAAGLHFTFIVAAAPASASYTIVTHDGSALIHGMAVSSADAGGSADSTAGTPADTITLVDGKAVEGDRVELVSDGTSWFAKAVSSAFDAITFTAA